MPFSGKTGEPFDAALSAFRTGFYTWWPAEDRLDWSVGLLRIYGRDGGPGGEVGFLDFIHPDDRLRVESETNAFLGSGADSYEHSFRIVRPDGAQRFILDRGAIERDANGTVRAFRGINVDLTGIVPLDAAARAGPARAEPPDASAQRGDILHAILESTPDLVWAKDRAGRITFGNTALFQAVGDGGPKGVVGRDAVALVPDPGQAQAIAANDAAVLRAGVPIRVEESMTRAGGTRLYETIKAPLRAADGDIAGIVGISRDITEHKQAEVLLHARNRQLDLLSRTATRLWLHDGPEPPLEAIFTDMAALVEADAFFHYRPTAPGILGQELVVGLDEPARAALEEVRYGELLCGRVAQTGTALVVEDLQNADAPGAEQLREWGAASYAGFPLLAHGRLIGTLGFASRRRTHFDEGTLRTLQAVCDELAVALDRQRLDRELRESNDRVRFALHAAGAGAWDWHIPSGRIVWSPENYVLYDIDPQPAGPAYADWEARLHPEDRTRANADVAAVVAGQAAEFRSEFRVVDRDGSLRWLLGLGRVERGPDGAAIRMSGINVDITARKRAEESLAEANALLESLFANAPVGIGVWGEDLRFRRLNDELAAMNGLPAEAHLGRRPDELLPELTDLDQIYAKWREVLRTGEPFRDFEVTGATPARPGEVRHWRESVFPVRIGARNVAVAAIVTETTEQKRAEAALRAAHDTFRNLVERSPFGIYVVDADFRLALVSQGAQKVFETVRPLIGRDFADVLRILWPEPFASEAISRFRHTLATGEPFQAPTTVERRADTGQDEAYDWKLERITMVDGRPGVVCHFYDLSERQRHEAQVQLLMHEVAHRSKNMLGLIQAIARNTAATGASEFLPRFAERIQALAAAQDLLIANEWRSVPLAALARSQLAHFADLVDSRITLAGPDLALIPAAAQALGMALHELGTNAAKHGALSTEAGRVVIAWGVAPDADGVPRFTIDWTEHDGPPVSQPQRRGFGSTLTTGMVQSSLEGVVSVDYRPGGLCWSLSCPAVRVLDAPPGAAHDPAEPPAFGPGRRGRRVLVVEDEPLIAAELEAMLTEAGCEVVGPAATLRQALDALGPRGCDAAVLDVNLGTETSAAIALHLTAAGTPFVVVTGYARDQLPQAFRAAPRLEKPVRPELLRLQLELFLLPGGR